MLVIFRRLINSIYYYYYYYYYIRNRNCIHYYIQYTVQLLYLYSRYLKINQLERSTMLYLLYVCVLYSIIDWLSNNSIDNPRDWHNHVDNTLHSMILCKIYDFQFHALRCTHRFHQTMQQLRKCNISNIKFTYSNIFNKLLEILYRFLSNSETFKKVCDVV